MNDSNYKQWRNPTLNIKDPLKRRWAEIVMNMDTHLNGICPIHIYAHRRPLESTDYYAIDYRVNNFEPVTKEVFDRALSNIIAINQSATVKLKTLDNLELYIEDKDFYDYCFSDLITKRENDPNAVIVLIPEITDSLDGENVIVGEVNPYLISSSRIEHIKDHEIKFHYGTKNDKNSYLTINGGQYIATYFDTAKNEYVDVPLVDLGHKEKPYIYISSNIVKEGKYYLRLPYLYGAMAWGNKFYGQESDFTVSATRYTYLKEIRAKQECREYGLTIRNGIHCDPDGNKCKTCGGNGYIQDDSPLSTIYVDYAKLGEDLKTLPEVIKYSEPPQGALITSKEITEYYFDRMLNSLGIIKQNLTNQSGTSKSFDYEQSKKAITRIFNDNLMVLKQVYELSEICLNANKEPITEVYAIGELGENTLDDLLEKLKLAKDNSSPSNVITSIVDAIYLKTLSPEFAEQIIDIAKDYDILYSYGRDDITEAKAHFGSLIGIREIVIHNTIIDKLEKYFNQNIDANKESAIMFLDNEYQQYVVPAQPLITPLAL